MELNHKINLKSELSTLWIVVMINMIFNDIFTIMVELDKWARPDFPADVKTLMLIAAFITNIPILMIYFSRILKNRANKIINICAAIFTIVYIWGGMMTYPHYIVVASIETILLILIAYKAWKWKTD